MRWTLEGTLLDWPGSMHVGLPQKEVNDNEGCPALLSCAYLHLSSVGIELKTVSRSSTNLITMFSSRTQRASPLTRSL